MQYDITLKTLFHRLPVGLLELLSGSQAMEILTVEFPTVQRRLPNLVLRLADQAQAVHRLFRKLAELNANARADALEQVVILAGLRSLKPLIEREIRQMPITVDIMKNDFLREAFEKGQREGRQEGEYRLLAKQLEQRFGPLPEDIIGRLRTARYEELERWGMALLSARTLDDVFQ